MKVLAVLLIFLGLHAEKIDWSPWDKTEVFKNDAYTFTYPSKFVKKDKEGYDIYLNGTGVGIGSFFNGGPFEIYVSIRQLKAENMEDAIKESEAAYPKIPDWYFYNPKRDTNVKKEDVKKFWFRDFYKPVAEKYGLPGASEAEMITGRSYEHALRFHQSRYDIVFKSKKDNKYRDLSAVFKFNDRTFEIEKIYNMGEYFKKVASGLELQ